jgi:hypothetical protein
MSDERVYLLRNIIELQKENAITEINKYKIFTDAPVHGTFTWWPYTLEGNVNDQESNEHTLNLKVIETPRVITTEDINSGDACYGYPHDAASQIVTLASLFLRRKFWINKHLSTNDVPIPKIPKSHKNFNDNELVKQEKSLAPLSEMFKLINNLNIDCQKRFLTAAKFYRRALLTIEEEPDMAYLHLVTSIEVLSGKHRSKFKSIKDYNLELYKILESMEDKKLKEKIESVILEREYPTSKFVEFITEHVENDFWGTKTSYGKIKSEDLKKILNRIYDQRSKTLHNGEPFPVNIFHPPLSNEDIDYCGLRSGENRWSPKDIIPYPEFFERLVNHVLIVYLKRNQIQ